MAHNARMGNVTTAGLSSHAFTFLSPDSWEARRAVTRDRYQRLNGREPPPEPPQVVHETLEENVKRFGAIRHGLDAIRARVHEQRPDVLVLIGDDQDENFTTANLPQFAVYVGDEFVTRNPTTGEERRFRAAPQLASDLVVELVEAGFDVASSDRFVDGVLSSHAHREPLEFLELPGGVSVLLVFVNAIHVPAPTPARCIDLGRQLRSAIDALDGRASVAFYSSGGFSHFTAGYPWRHYEGDYTLGSIAEDFDREVVAAIRDGRGDQLGSLTSADLLANGQVELRQHLVLLGALDGVKPRYFAYEPFYRAVMGMAVGLWAIDR